MKNNSSEKLNPLALGRFAIECFDEVIDKDAIEVLAPAGARISLSDKKQNLTPICTTAAELKNWIEDMQLTIGRLYRMAEQFLPALEQNKLSPHLAYDDDKPTKRKRKSK